MRLAKAQIEGFRSVKETLELHVDPRITVVLGANDHGKSNILQCLANLNADNPFKLEDLNWDLAENAQDFPFAEYYFVLSKQEQATVLEIWLKSLGGNAESNSQGAAPSGSPPTIDDVPSVVSTSRRGVGQPLKYATTPDKLLEAALLSYLKANTPRMELIKPFESVVDSVGPEEITQEPHEFMQGIFFEAGLDPLKSKALFDQTDRTTRQIDGANKVLDANLRAGWAQGRDAVLHFRLDHKNGRIELQIEDPAVSTQFARASRRSSGFTHFFAMNMVLQARKKKNPAASRILLFDEPGIYLHPTGQRDLLQVLESLGRSSQIVYSTHSLFMINRNFPTRHRLIIKDSKGTRVDGKPYVAQWKAALDWLGLGLPGTILFAHKILLTEGDTDPIYVYAMLQSLMQLGLFDADINGFSAISTGTSRDTAALVQLFGSASTKCDLALLFDGDEGGAERLKALRPIIVKDSLPYKVLQAGTSIEDHLPFLRTCYPQAVADYCFKLATAQDTNVLDPVKVREEFQHSFDAQFPDTGNESGVAEWAKKAAQDVLKLDEPSKVGIAREYVSLLADKRADLISHEGPESEIKRSKAIAEMIKSLLVLPSPLADTAVLAG